MVHARFVSFLAMLAVQASALAPNGHPNKLPKVVRRLSRILRGLGPTRGVPLAGAGETTSTGDAGVADSYTESPHFEINVLQGQHIQQNKNLAGTNNTNVYRLVLEVTAEYDRWARYNQGHDPSWEQFHVNCPSLHIRGAAHTLNPAKSGKKITETIILPIDNYAGKGDHETCTIQAYAMYAGLGVKSQGLICKIGKGGKQAAERCTANPKEGRLDDGDGYVQSPAVHYASGSYTRGASNGIATPVTASFHTALSPGVQWERVEIDPSECTDFKEFNRDFTPDQVRTSQTRRAHDLRTNGVQTAGKSDFEAGRQDLKAKIYLTDDFDCWMCRIQAFATHTESGHKLKSIKQPLNIRLGGACERKP